MKGQVSVEFISLLSITLLGLAVLITQINEKAIEFENSESYKESRFIGQKVSYIIDYVKSEGNMSKTLEFDSDLKEQYDIVLEQNRTTIIFDEGNTTIRNTYSGPKKILNTTENYEVKYNDSFHIK